MIHMEMYRAASFLCAGYGHITTKTSQGKIATILYSAFGVPLMMLFVANIGSTMAKMFSFVFTRITMIFCCRMSNKKKRAIRNRQKLLEKANQSQFVVDEKALALARPPELKSSLKTIPSETGSTSTIAKQSLPSQSGSSNDVHASSDLRQLPADIRLNMLTGITNPTTPRSLTSSTPSVAAKPKDALVRINELIRQNSSQDIEQIDNVEDEPVVRRRSADAEQIQYYINETKKLTSNLDSPMAERKPVAAAGKDESNMKQVRRFVRPKSSPRAHSI